MTVARGALLFVGLCSLAWLSACGGAAVDEGACAADSDCGADFRCVVGTGVCVRFRNPLDAGAQSPQPDLGAGDLAAPDLAAPDLAAPDLAGSD